MVNPVKVSTLQPDIKNKGRIGLYLIISAIIVIIFAFLLIGVIEAFKNTGDFNAIVSLCSFIPIGIGGMLVVRGFIAFKNQPPQVINVEARITRIDKFIDANNQARFVPILSYVFGGHIIENPCHEIAHTVPDYQINASIIIPIDTTDPHIYWINSKPRPIIPKKVFIGFTVLAIGLIMLIVPLFV